MTNTVPELEELKRLSSNKITKGRLAALRAAHGKVCELCRKLEPKLRDEETAEEFEDASMELEEALSNLQSACDELDGAEEKEEREDAISEIEGALADAVSALERTMEVAVVTSMERVALKQECDAKLREILQQKGDITRGFSEWIESTSDPELKKKRIDMLKELLSS